MDDLETVQKTCSDFVASVQVLNPAWLHKPKFHLLLHLGDDMMCFGPTAAFNAERYSHAKLHLPVILFCVCADVKFFQWTVTDIQRPWKQESSQPRGHHKVCCGRAPTLPLSWRLIFGHDWGTYKVSRLMYMHTQISVLRPACPSILLRTYNVHGNRKAKEH